MIVCIYLKVTPYIEEHEYQATRQEYVAFSLKSVGDPTMW
jgi:hypothetical protein